MKADSHNLTPGGQYTPSDRAQKAQTAATAHMNGKQSKPFYGEGMQTGNTTPATEKTNTKPLSPASKPTSKDLMQRPGVGADNSKVKRSSQV